MILGLQRHTIRLVPHQNGWKEAFEAEKQRLELALTDSVISIEHIGSTAIPGLLAKPVIDIGIGLSNYEAGFACVAALEELGYLYKGENGIAERHYFRTNSEIVLHHLHMFPDGHPKLRDHLLFRDYLLAHPEELQAYQALKLILQQENSGNRQTYTEGKHDFITRILQLARQGD
ncbi:MAG: GrpB family protein [Bacteroidota bacterium]